MREVDTRSLAADARLETDVCVVGSGPAGLVVAAELAAQGTDVILLESGAPHPGGAAQNLNRGRVTGDPYVGLSATRQRAIGGTTSIWNTAIAEGIGAKYVPLDPVDLRDRPGRSGWPIEPEELEPFYARAWRRCLGFEPEGAGRVPDRSDPAICPSPAAPLVPGVYRLQRRDVLIDPCRAALKQSDQGGIYYHATVTEVVADASGTRIERLDVASPGGLRCTVHPQRVVLAGGAIENARLLLASGPDGLGNQSGWVGRGFMEHPRDGSIRIRPPSNEFYRAARFYDLHASGSGDWRLGRIGVAASAVVDRNLPNASGTLLPVSRAGLVRGRFFAGRFGRLPGVRAALYPEGHGWSERRHAGALYDGLRVLLNVEQSPHPENRIELASDCDAFGVPRARLHWTWREDDAARLARLRDLFAAALAESGFGEVVVDPPEPPDPNAHHHAGTTRMHRDSASGVCDPDLRVHSTDNLFLAGASVFPTAGFANPVLTIVALAIRLADHLAGGEGG